jgi:hypothetical protein
MVKKTKAARPIHCTNTVKKTSMMYAPVIKQQLAVEQNLADITSTTLWRSFKYYIQNISASFLLKEERYNTQ